MVCRSAGAGRYLTIRRNALSAAAKTRLGRASWRNNAYIIGYDLLPDQHVHARLAIVCEHVLRCCQDQTVALARDVAKLFAADPDLVPGDVDRMFDSLSIELVGAAISTQRLI